MADQGTIHSRMTRWCELHWLRWETLTPAQAQRAEQLADTTMDYLPELLRGGLVRWIVKGTPPGSFLTAVLSNDLVNAVCRADDEVGPHLRALVKWIYNHAPAVCWGSPERVSVWPLIATRTAEPIKPEEVPY